LVNVNAKLYLSEYETVLHVRAGAETSALCGETQIFLPENKNVIQSPIEFLPVT
jgi:hypothetical protein